MTKKTKSYYELTVYVTDDEIYHTVLYGAENDIIAECKCAVREGIHIPGDNIIVSPNIIEAIEYTEGTSGKD